MKIGKENEYDLFISYRHKTGFYMAELLYSKLTANGYSVFMDKNMYSGRYEEKIHTAILNSKNFIIVLFPNDMSELKDEESWLNIESGWALENKNINIIPVMCDGFKWPKKDDKLTKTMKTIKKYNGLSINKNNSFDKDLDNLCDGFLENVSSFKPTITAEEFFKYNLEDRSDLSVSSVDVAFHAGAPWIQRSEKNRLLINSLNNKTHWRVLINTVGAAESIGRHMRSDTAYYLSFEEVHAQWKKLAELYPDVLEVRQCDIPLIHIHHSVKFSDKDSQNHYGELHIKYYAYDNTNLDNAFEHRINSHSKFYSIYDDEFEYLWSRSKKL